MSTYSHLLGVHVELLSAHGHLFVPLHTFPKNRFSRTEPQLTALQTHCQCVEAPPNPLMG